MPANETTIAARTALDMTDAEYAAFLPSRTLGGSDMAAILNISPFDEQTPVGLWERLMRLVRGDRRAPQFERGRTLEPIVKRMVAEQFPYRVVAHPDGTVRSARAAYLRASPDGLLLGEAGSLPGLLEIKCPGLDNFERAQAHGIPAYYQCQVQHYLDTLGLSWGMVAFFNADRWQLHVEVVQHDAAYCRDLYAAVNAYWTRYVVPRVRPDRTSYPSIVPLLPEAPRDHEDATQDAALTEAVGAYLVAQAAAKQADAAKDAARDALMAVLGTRQKVRAAGNIKISCTEQGRSSWDTDALVETLTTLQPDLDLAPYRRRTVSRAVRVTPPRSETPA